MNIHQYVEYGRASYAEFASVIAQILELAINRHGGIRFQPIQRRAKDVQSLRTKIEARNSDDAGRQKKVDAESIEAEIKDLAGVRVVFYTNGDIERFRQSRIIFDSFDIDVERTKIHHPVPDVGQSINQFRSDNIVVKLKEDRLALPEYAKFRGMVCEIQIQTILNHAWSETAHDITYKGIKFDGLGNRQLTTLRNQLDRIMEKYLLPAGHEFQQVWDAYQRLLKGKALIDSDAISKLIELADNNERIDQLKMIDEHILRDLDDYPRQYPSIRSKLTESAIVSFRTPLRPRVIGGVSFNGVTATEYLHEILECLNRYRMADVQGTLDDLFQLYAAASEEEQRREVIASVKRFSEHSMAVWERAGPYVQTIVSNKLKSLSAIEVILLRDIVLAATEAILSTEVTGTVSSYKAVTIKAGAIVASETMRAMRRDALDRLKKLYAASSSQTAKREVIQVMNGATQLPYTVGYSDDLRCDVISDMAFIAEFYADIAQRECFEILQSLEHDLLWWHRRTTDIRMPNCEHQGLLRAKEALDRAIVSFRRAIDVNEGFQIHKTLVGYESVFLPMWERDDAEFDVTGVAQYREKRAQEFIAKINVDTKEIWFEVIVRACQTVSNDGATFLFFGPFLDSIGEKKPDIAIDYIGRIKPDDRTKQAIPGLLIGLFKSRLASKVEVIIDEWLTKEIFLLEVCLFMRLVKPTNVDRLALLMKKALVRNDEELVLFVLVASFNTGAENASSIEVQVFRPALAFFLERKSASWVNTISWMPKETWLIPYLLEDTCSTMIESMQYLVKIDHRAERVLTGIGERYPNLVAQLFDRRLWRVSEGNEIEKNYEAIPHYIDKKLSSVLQRASSEVINAVRLHYEDKGHAKRYLSIRFLRIAFPDFSNALPHHLLSLIDTGERDDLLYVAFVLREYDGDTAIEETAKYLVNALPADDALLGEVRIALESSGPVAGEFGFVELYKERKARISAWLEDPREKVRMFAADFIHRLDNDIASEQRRAEEDIARQKAQFGDDSDNSD